MIPSEAVNELLTARGTTDYTLNSISSTGLTDPDNPSKGPVTVTTDYPILSFPSEISSRNKFFEIVKEDDMMLIVDTTGLDVVPKSNDLVTHSTDGVYTIIKVKTYKDQGAAYLYVLQIRR